MLLEDLQLFVRVADCGSISAAAAELELSAAAASAAIKRLEKQLDTLLFVRSTRNLRLTAAGERYLIHCRNALEQLCQAERALQEEKGEVAGTLAIAVSSDFGRNLFLPWLDTFLARHPKLEVRLQLGDQLSSFYRDQLDVALRYGKPQDSSEVAFKLCSLRRQLCASADYLARHGWPQTPGELSLHECLLYKRGERTHDLWHFWRDGQEHKVRVSGRRSSNDADLARRWAVAGQGLVYKSRLDLAEDMIAGRLLPLLPDFDGEPLELYMLCPGRQHLSPAILLLRDFLRERITEQLARLETMPGK
ncbi:LysR family transcriptional regulator [Shewanella cyperi]|uniref:LysR family transcriptional regulator n=1 Tax=Shewanella cyperi TaxID=2814292 RepID=A0A975AKH0_9GAMM|nr:LysR family transcriptional regulator [Shewanella cyperi]QSX29731.1 LysR family transcriptional regulator [Shewanella cyperi]